MVSFFSPREPNFETTRFQALRSAKARKVTPRLIKYAVNVIILVLASTAWAPLSLSQIPAQRVLIVSGYDPGHPAVNRILQSLTNTIRNGSKGRVEFFYEFQENLRIPNSKYEYEMVHYLQRKYEGVSINLIVALGAPALKFLLSHEPTLFTDVPKTYYFHDEREETARSLWPRVTGVWADLELNKTLDIALGLHPGTQNVIVVSGNSDQDKFIQGEALAAFHDYESRFRFTYLTDLTIDELRSKVAALPPQTVVIYLSYFADKLGNGYSGPEALSLIAPSSSAPIYGISDTYLGSGIVGGSLLDFEALGKSTGELGLRLIAGEKSDHLSPNSIATVAKFDWRELHRWNIDTTKLPPHSVIEFVPPSFWALYKWYVVIALAAILIQAFLIARLLITRARRRQAEVESQRLALLAESEHKQLGNVISNVPGIVWETRIDENGVPRTTFVSEQVEKMMGYSADEWRATPGFALSIIHDEDRERVARESNAIFEGHDSGVIQYRWITKDGRVLWVEAHLAAILNQSGQAVGIRGVTIDVTEQQIAEDARKQSEERNRAILQAIPDLMFLQTRDGVYLDYHVRDPKDLAVPPEAFLGKNMAEVLPPELAKSFLQLFRRAEPGEPQVLEYELDIGERHGWFEARVVSTGENILSVVRDVTSRKLAEIALTHNEAQLAGMISSAMDGIITIDENHKIVLFNPAAEKLFQCPAHEVLGQSVDQFIPLRFRNMHSLHIRTFGDQAVTRRLMGFPGDLYGLRKSGEEFPIEASISQINLSGQKFYTVILRDITEAKNAVDELRHSEERFGKAFKANPQPMSITTLSSGIYLDVNDSFLEMSGYQREEVLAHSSLELGIWETPDHRTDFVNKLNEQGSIVNLETKFRTKDGSLRVLLSSAEKLELAGQECLLVASSDITERVAAQRALLESEERFRNMADTAPVMIWISGADKGCSYFNKQWLDFTGRSIEEELGQGWEQGIYSKDYERCLEIYQNAFDERRPFEMEYRLRRHDGEYRWIVDCGTPRLSSDGQFLGYIGSCMDITERKESEVALRRAHEELHELKNQLEAENIYLQQELQRDETFGEIVGHSDAIKYVLFKITQVAPTDSTVLVTGETGTGKELVARAIHGASARNDRPLIKVNCGALSPSLIESELFGHEKGAFTGAGARKLGRFELANGGTIFLDEIGELPPELQVKLLRVIQENEFERLGGTKTIKTDVRIIAATNRNLKSEVENGTFREDLWYRLNVYPITVPPLRQRKEDIPLLVDHFVGKYAKKFGRTITSISPRAMLSFQSHSWPGNIRELANVIERAVIHTHANVLNVVDRFEETPEETSSSVKTLEEIERDHIIRTLENTGWRIEGPHGAAKVLGLNPSTLRTRMLKLGIQRRRASYA